MDTSETRVNKDGNKNYTQDKVYILQHSYSKAAVELEPKFGQIIHKTKSTYYNTATPRLQWN